jgi:hypothetical protein
MALLPLSHHQAQLLFLRVTAEITEFVLSLLQTWFQPWLGAMKQEIYLMMPLVQTLGLAHFLQALYIQRQPLLPLPTLLVGGTAALSE